MNKEHFLTILGLDTNASIDTIFNSLFMYLRKSRKDMEYYKDEPLEKTLQRHEKQLQDWITSILGLPIPESNIIREVASGDTISDRPGMTKVLELIENDKIKGVICLEIERLARGNTIDQGVIAQTFQLTKTKILTPMKIYDLDNENDLSFFEEGLHQSRNYLMYTKKILMRGRKASINEGKYPFSTSPYGYNRKKIENEKGYTLEFNDNEYKVVRLIIDLFLNGLAITYEKDEKTSLKDIKNLFGITNEVLIKYNPELNNNFKGNINIVIKNMGAGRIAKYLNFLDVKPRKGKVWTSSMIKNILTSSTVFGYVTYDKRKTVKKISNKIVYESRPINNDYLKVKGNFKSIATEDEYIKIKSKLENNSSPHCLENQEQSALVGLMYCEKCGKKMFKKKNNSCGKIKLIRKYTVDKEKLNYLLRKQKEISNLSINQIAHELKTTRDVVSNMFTPDLKRFIIPTPKLWEPLKELLNIKTDEFDESIMTFVEQENKVIKDSLICNNPYCDNISNDIKLVETEIINSLKIIYHDYNIFIKDYQQKIQEEYKSKVSACDIITDEIKKINIQLDKACELVETGVYTQKKYLERTQILNARIQELKDKKKQISTTNETLNKFESRKKALPIIENVLNNYNDNLTSEEKNLLLKSIIKKVEYRKDVKGGKFSLKIILYY